MEQATETLSAQYLSFMLGSEVYAIDISKVREVLDFVSVTKVPKTPRYMRGVINLRGSVVPVVDMKMKFEIERTERTVNTCIIITEVEVEGEQVVIGMLADSVREVFDLGQDDIEEPPRIGTKVRTDFLDGMGKKDNEFILILDIDRVFSAVEVGEVLGAGSTLSLSDEAGPAQ